MYQSVVDHMLINLTVTWLTLLCEATAHMPIRVCLGPLVACKPSYHAYAVVVTSNTPYIPLSLHPQTHAHRLCPIPLYATSQMCSYPPAEERRLSVLHVDLKTAAHNSPTAHTEQ